MAYIPFSKRPVWNDVAPIPQDDGPNPVVPIDYLPQCSVPFQGLSVGFKSLRVPTLHPWFDHPILYRSSGHDGLFPRHYRCK